MCNVDFERGSESFVALFLSVFELCQETDREGPFRTSPPAGRGLTTLTLKATRLFRDATLDFWAGGCWGPHCGPAAPGAGPEADRAVCELPPALRGDGGGNRRRPITPAKWTNHTSAGARRGATAVSGALRSVQLIRVQKKEEEKRGEER